MRRLSLAAFVSALVLAATPALASAHRHHSHSHHFRNRTEHFRGVTRADSSTSQTAPTTPNVTVASMTNGVLTLTLADGSTISGKVTDDTEVVCAPSSDSQMQNGRDDRGDGGWGGGNSGGGDWGGGGSSGGGDWGNGGNSGSRDWGGGGSSGGGDWGNGGDGGGGPGDDNGGGDGGNGPSCGLADLLPNAVVTAADLRFTSAGAEWERIELG
jgi:hypothetical protein